MRYLTLLFITLSFAACQSKPNAKEKWLQDTLAVLRRKADFKALPADEAYDFINKYYLPILDSSGLGRKISLHPLQGTNYQELFRSKEKQLRSGSINVIELKPPFIPQIDSASKWSAEKLKGCILVSDTLITDQLEAINRSVAGLSKGLKFDQETIDDQRSVLKLRTIREFRKRYGRGYVIISIPQYNPQTKRLVLEEWIEGFGQCTGHPYSRLFFKKTANGWEEL